MKFRLGWLKWVIMLAMLAMLALLAACAPAATPSIPVATQAPAPTEAPAAIEAPAATEAVIRTQEVVKTAAPTQPPPALRPTPTPFIEERLVELEWPERLRLGESDVLRLSLVPSKDGYVTRAEFDEHPVATKEAPVRHVPGYTLLGIARLDGVGFEIEPRGDQRRIIPPGEEVTWRWTLRAHQPGQQRLSVSLTLRWDPEPGVIGPVSESLAFGRGLEVRVDSLLGMTRGQAMTTGLISLLLSFGLGTYAAANRRPPPAPRLRIASPNPALSLELGPGIHISPEETHLIQGLFARYSRLLFEHEFKSGYSGARAFLVRPVTADGRADAETIAKIGPSQAIQAEFDHYERYVKDRLPPVTARIQHPPVALRRGQLAALQYTFICKPGHPPLSLRQALIKKPDPAALYRLFDTFGPNWWMQRQPYTFRMEQEYDQLLPPHWLVEPAHSGRTLVRLEPGERQPVVIGQIARLGAFKKELRPDGKSWSLSGDSRAGVPPLRLRWLSPQPPARGATGKITASRLSLLQRWCAGFERFDLPDPLERLESWLATTIQGTRSTIHGDLNLENILVGPGELVWLIDFAQTREGHPLFDFAHLEAELVAHVLASRCGSARAYLDQLSAGDELLNAVEEIAGRCLFDPARPAEFHLALGLACLGALKFANLSPLSKHCLYLTAAFQAQRI
jgi:Ternary complex associated domain 9